MMVWFEIRKYLQEYKKIVLCAVSAVITCALLYMGVNAITQRQSLFEPFSVGIVDYDNTAEAQFIYDFFGETINLEKLDKPTAVQKLERGEIPAYVEFPQNFSADIMSGVNTPFHLYGNQNFPVQVSVTKLLATGGIAFLSSAQSGIYAALDYAYAGGMTREAVNSKVFYQVNIAFGKKLIDHAAFFSVQTLSMSETSSATTLATHYVYMFATFWLLINLLAFEKTLRGYTPAIYARYKLAGYPLCGVQLIRLLGLWVLNTALALPTLYLAFTIGKADAKTVAETVAVIVPAALVTALCVSAFGLMAAALFRNGTACGLFIFLTALLMLFFGGGIVPLVYLPREMHVFRYMAINHWVMAAVGNNGAAAGLLMLLLYSAFFFGVVLIAEFLYTSVSNKA